jgi:hypothetical protein
MAALLVLAAGLVAAGCTKSTVAAAGADPPAKLDSIGSSNGIMRVTLTQRAAERLAIKTVPVRKAQVAPAARSSGGAGGKSVTRKVIPYSAVLYDVDGKTWVFTSPSPLGYVRAEVTVDYVTGDTAVLTQGPAVGMPVVSEGAAELYGTELGVGAE